jgi:hypothetical protein
VWRFLVRIDTQVLQAVLTRWLRHRLPAQPAPQRKGRVVIAVDGKMLRGARLPDGREVNLLSAYDTDTGIVLGQVAIAAKSNDATGLTGACGDALAGLRQRRGMHDPGRIEMDLAVMLADGGEAISDLAVLRDQAQFGPVASDSTGWRLLSDMDGAVLGRLRQARTAARELAWAQRFETRGGCR